MSLYATESFKSNVVRDYTSWIAVPPSTIDITTDPKDTVITQGEEKIIPAEFETPLSDNVTRITFDNGQYYSFDGLNVSAERIHPPLFEVKAFP